MKAACSIRGEVDAARYEDYILPLVFYKRLADEWDIPHEQVEALVEADRQALRDELRERIIEEAQPL